MRKLDRSKEAPVFTVYPHDPILGASERVVSQVPSLLPSLPSFSPQLLSQSIVTAVEFSKARQNLLAVGTSQKDYVSLYGIRNSPSDLVSRTPLLTIPAPGGVKFLSWQGTASDDSAAVAPPSAPSSGSAAGSGAPKNASSSSQLSIVDTLFSSQREHQQQRMPQTFSGAGIAPQIFLNDASRQAPPLSSLPQLALPEAQESEVSKNRFSLSPAPPHRCCFSVDC
jgi:hypothetical protein